MDNKKIGLFIASLRKEIGLTQKDLADKLFITDRAVSKWERGLSLPDISLLDNLSSILGVNVIIHLIPAVIASIALLLMGNMIPAIAVFSTVLLAFGCKVLYLYLKVH